MAAGTGKTLRDMALGAIALGFFAVTIHHQTVHYSKWNQGSGKYIQRVNIPDENTIRIAAVGYDNLYADFLMLRAVQMFGAAWEAENKSTDPIYNYFDILTSLDPRFPDIYEFSNLVLSDENGDDGSGENRGHKQALQLLRKGISKNRTAWRLPYLGMYTALWGMNEPELAREFIVAAKRNPTTPDHVIRMEEYIARQSGAYYAAFDVNLGQFLEYVDRGMDVERDVAMRKFDLILDGWYRLEIARACDEFLKNKGRIPNSTEELLASEHIPRFRAPLKADLFKSLQSHATFGVDLKSEIDEIREESMHEFVGLPPEPNGTWYYLSSVLIEQTRRTGLPETDKLDQKHRYIVSHSATLKELDAIALRAQQMIFGQINETGIAPSHNEMLNWLTDDGSGGHWVYFPEVEGEDGQILPRFFSTTQIRTLQNMDPRLGFQGTIDGLPVREYPVTDTQLPYLTAEPSIWDFPEDQNWALCRGLEPGIKIEEQPQDLLDLARQPAVYIHCDHYIPVPEPGGDPVLRP